MSNSPFVHLHCHSHYSLLDGAGRIERLLERASDAITAAGTQRLHLVHHGLLH